MLAKIAAPVAPNLQVAPVLIGRYDEPRAIYMSQNLRFKAPVKSGDTVTATCTVTEIIPEKKRAVLQTICKVGDTVVIEGDALIMVPSRGK